SDNPIRDATAFGGISPRSGMRVGRLIHPPSAEHRGLTKSLRCQGRALPDRYQKGLEWGFGGPAQPPKNANDAEECQSPGLAFLEGFGSLRGGGSTSSLPSGQPSPP